MNNIKNHKMEIVFKIWFLLYTMLSVCNLIYGKQIISFVMWPMICLGGVVILIRLIHFKEYLQMKGTLILLFFTMSFLISIVINHEYGLKDNLITLSFWCFYFFILYTRTPNESRETWNREFEILGYVYVVYTTIGFMLSLVMFFMEYSHVYTNQRGYEVAAGFIWGRLWGVFIDPNSAAVMATVAICFILYFWKKTCNKLLHCIMCIDIVISILYIAFSDSRTGRVCLGTIIFTYILFNGLYKKRESGLRAKVGIWGIAFAVGIMGFYLPKGISSLYNVIQLENSENNKEEDVNLVERGYDIETDISNRRFQIWESGIEIFFDSPVVGVTFGGMREYAEDNLPETYIVNNDYKDFNTLDNDYLNVITSQGVLGLVFMLLFVGIVLITIFKRIMVLEPENFRIGIICLMIVASISVSALFRAAMFYHSSPNANIFWSVLGILMLIVREKREA